MSNKDKNVFEALGISDPEPVEKSKPLTVEDIIKKGSEQQGLGPLPRARGTGMGKLNKFDTDLLPNIDLVTNRARNQTTISKIGRTVGNLIPNIGANLVEYAGYAGELIGYGISELSDEEYKTDFTNAVTEWAKEAKNPLGEAHRYNNDVFDLDDWSWWLNNGSGLVESIGSFLITGAGVGKGAMWVAGKVAGRVTKGMKSARAIRYTEMGTSGAGQAFSAGTLAYFEGAMSGAEMYDQVRREVYDKTGDPVEATKTAAESAALTTMTSTAIVTALNLTSFYPLFKSRSLLNKGSKWNLHRKPGETNKAFAQRMAKAQTNPSSPTQEFYSRFATALEVPQEAAEEVSNLYAEARGRQEAGISDTDATGFDLWTETLMTEEGVLAALLGGIGGAAQTAGMMNLPMHRRNVADPGEDPDIQWLSRKELESIDETKAGATYAKSLEADIRDIIKAQEELETAMSNKDEARAEIARLKLFDVASKRSIPIDGGEAVKQSLREIAEMDNETDLLSEATKQLEALSGQEPTQETQMKTDQLTQQIEALNTWADARGIDPANGITEAMQLGLAENQKDNEYKEKAENKLTEVDEMKEEYLATMGKYNYGDEQALGLAEYVFDLQNRRRRAESNVEFIDTQLANLEAEISKISSDILPDDLVGEAGEEVAAMRLGAKRDAIRENLEEFKEEKRQAEKGNKQLLQEYKAQTKEQALQEINKSIKQTEEQLKALDERVSQIVPSLYVEAQKTFNMRKDYKDGLKTKDKATKILRALTRRLAFVESNEGRADFVKKAFEAYKSEVKTQKEVADKLDTKEAEEIEQAGVSEARLKKEAEKKARLKKEAEKKASKPEPKPKTDTKKPAVSTEQDPNKLQDLSSLMKGESKPDNTQDRGDTTDIAGETPSDTTGDGENVNAKDSTDKILTLTEDITEATEKKRDPEYRPKAIAGNKIQYGNVQDYVEIVDDDGTVRKVTSADGRNTIVEPRLESKINSLRGTDVRISVDENYAGNTIDEDGNTVDNVPTDLYNKPMKIETVDGKLLGYVPQLTWITRQDEAGNYVNVADFQTESGYSNAHLQEEIVKLIRETVDKEGSMSSTINDISQGVPLYNRTEDGRRVKGPASELLPDPEFSIGVVKAGIANYGEGRPSVPVQKNMKDGTVVGNYAGVSMPMWIREISAEDAQIIKKAIVAKATNNEEAIKEISDVVENIDEPIAFDSVAGLAELISRKVYTSRFDRKSLSKAPNPNKVFFHVDPQSGFVHLARPNDGTIYTTNPGKVDQEGYEPLVVDGEINPEAAEYIDKLNSNVRRSHLNTEGSYDDISIVDGKVDAVTYNSYNEYAKTLLDSFIDGRNTIEHPEIGTEYLYWQQQVNSYDYTGAANSTVTKLTKEPAEVVETVEQKVDEVSQQTEEDLDPTPDDDPFYRPKQGRKSLKDLENERSSNSNNPYSDSDTIDVGFPATVDEKLDEVLSRYNIGGFSHSQVSQVVDSIMLAVREKISNTEGDVPPTVQETLEEAKNRFMDQYSDYKDASDEARTNAFRDILKTWDKFADRAVNHLKAIGFEPVEGGVIEGEQSNYEKTKYEDKARWQQNSKDTASAQLKLFLSQIPRQSYNISGDNKVLVTRESEWLGLNTYVPLDEIYDKMTALFVDTTPKFDNMMEILKEAGQDYPPYMTVYNQLKNLPPTSTLKAEFQRVMSKQYIDMVIALFNPQYDDLGNLTGYESKPVHSDRNSAIDLIYGEWVENMKDSDLIKNVDGSLVIDHEEANRIKEEYIEKMDGQSVLKNREVVRGLLESIGVELAEATWKTILRNNNKALVTDGNLSDNFKIIDGKPVNNTFLDILFKTLPTEAPQDFETGNPLAGDSMKSRFRKLASFEYNHSDKVYTSSYNDINNNNIYPYQMNTFLSDRIRDMKSREELREILGKLSFSKYSRWIQNPDKVTLEYTDGLKNQLTKRGNSGSDLSQIDTDLLSVTMYFGTVNQTRGEFGRFQTTTKSDKTMFPIIKAPRVAPTVKVDGDTGEIIKFLGKQTSKGARLAIRNLIKAEFGRIYNFRTSVEQQLKNQGIDLGGYMEGARHFILLPELNAEVAETYIDKGVITREEFNRVWKGGFAHLQQATDSTDFAINIMQKVVEARILEESKALFEDWKTNGIVRESARNVPTADGGTKKVNTLSSFLDANYLRYQTPYSKAESRLHYAALDFTLNHHLNMAEEYMVVSGDPAQFWKKSKEGGLMNDIRSTIENLNKRLAKDIAPKSDGLYDDPTFRMIAIVDPELDSKQMNELGEAYGGMEIADAQEYTTVVEHLRNMKAEGKISPAKYDELLAVVEPGQYYEFTPEQMGDIFSPTKPVYVGDHVLSEEYDVNLMSYTKSSAFPLLPQFLKGFELDKLRTAMETQKVDRASYMTANKLGAVNPVNIFDGREIKKDLTFGDSVRSYNRSGFGLQQEVPVKDKTVINVVSQANKLLFASIRNTEGFKFEGSLFTGRELEVVKENIRNTLLRKAEQELYDKLGAEIVDGDMQFDDLTKVHELLKSEAEGRGWTISAIESIQLSEDKQSFILPLALSSNAGAIESLLLSQVSNITLGQKVHGYSYVQGSSAGLVGYDTAKNEGIDFTPTAEFQSTGLNFISEGEDSTEFADIIVPWRFKDDQGNPLDINDFTDENGVIDSKKLPEEVRRLIGLRIPNQGHNSMLPMRIVGFLPRNAGTLAIVPEEIVAQMGSDFDVDKLYTYAPDLNYSAEDKSFSRKNFSDFKTFTSLDGTRIVADTNDLITYETEGDPINYLDVEGKMTMVRETGEDADLETFSTDDLMDMYFQIFESVLSHPSMYEKLKSPLDKDDLLTERALIESVQKGSQAVASPASYRGQRDYRLNQRSGQKLVGIGALANTLLAVIQDKQKANLELQEVVENEPRAMTIDVNIGGKDVFLSTLSGEGTSKYNGEVRTKGDNISLFLTAAVDNANLNILGPINWNTYTAGAVVTLLMLEDSKGNAVDLGYAAKFTSQPIVREMVAEAEKLNSASSEESSLDAVPTAINTVISEYKTKVKGEFKRVIVSDKDLKDMLDLPPLEEMTSQQASRQISVLMTFRELNEVSQDVRELQQAILSPESDGTDNRAIQALRRAKEAEQVREGGLGKIANTRDLMFNIEGDYSEQSVSMDVIYNNTKKLVSSLLPEYTKYFEPTVDVLNKLTGRNYSNDQLTTIWRETRKYLNSGFKEMGLGDVSAIRSRLIFGDEETAPLANRLQEAKNTWGKENYFLQRLLVEKSTKPGEVPSTIKFQADKSIRLDDSNNSTALASMLKSGVEEERKLAEDLVLYDLVTGGVQGAVQYSKYIPPAYLEYLGIKKAFNADYDANISAMQILQHNPKLATRIDGDSPIVNGVIKSKNGIDGILIAPITSAVSHHLTYQSDEGLEYPRYISMFDNTRKTFSLFKHGSTSSNGTVRFNRVATLGQPNVSEYQAGTVVGESILTNNVVKRPAEPVNRDKGRTKPNDVGLLEDLGPFKDIIPADRVTVEGNTLKTDITYSEFMEMVDFDEEHKPVAEALIKYIKDVKTPINFVNSASNSRSASVMFNSTKNKDENTVEVTLENIFIYPDKFNIEKLQEIVLHEAVHIATVKAIYENKLPAVAKLNALYHTAKRELITRGEFEEYQITNLAEFVAFAMTNKDFQKKLNDIPFENKTARDRFKNLIIDLITTITEAMGITVNPGSVLEQTIGNVISLMEDSVVGEDSDVKATPQDTRNVSNKGLGELGFPAFGDIDPTVEKIAQTLTTRISTIKAKMLKSNDVKKSQELEKALDRVQTQLSNLVNNATADGIIAVAKAQAEWAKEIASDKRSSDSVFATAKDTTRSWDYEITQDYLKPQQRRNDNPIREALYQADLIMQPARDAINNAMLLRVRDLVNKDMPEDQHISVKSLQFMEDIGYSTQYFLDISQVDNQLAQYLFELLTTNAKAAGTELLQFDQKLNEQLDKMEDEDWEVFKQKDEEGNWTGDFIDEYSSKYYAREKGIISSYKAKLRKAETLDPQSATRLKNAASILYHKEINELRETVDTRMLLVKGYQSPIWDSKKEYISHLEKQYGKQKAQSMVQQAEMQYQEYKRARRVKKDDLAVDYVSASTELSEEAWIEQELKNWELKNDPMRALDEKFGVVGEKITNYYAETAADYLVAVPRAKDKRGKSTGFYDSAFEKLTDNQRDFYNFYINSISKLQKFLPRYDTRDLTRNFFPRVQKDLIEEYNTGGLKGSLRYANEALVNSISAGRTAELRVEKLSDYQEIDPATGKPKNTIDVLFTNRKIETDKLSFNVPATLRMFAGMAINYKWKSSIEDRANLVMQVARDAKRIETRGGKQLFDRYGDPVSLREGAIKLTEVMGYSVEAIVYNEKRQEYKESNIPLFDTWNPFTNHEKRVRMRELENKRDELEEQLEDRKVSQEDYTDAMEKMEQEYRDLGGKNLVWGKLGDRLLEYTQVKGMGYNLTAGIANVGFGVLSNATWAASGRDFTGKELTKAYGLITRSILPGGSMKIANLVKLFDVLFEVTETEYGKSSNKEARNKSKTFNFISNNLTPYAIQRRTEYTVQAASMVAQMLNKKITVTDNKTGEEVEIDLFEAYDEKANWKERYSQPDEWKPMDTPGQSLTEFARMKNKVIQVNKYLHGNYDPNSPILLKKYLIGRLLGQFRSWIPYGIKQRIGKEQYDRMLGRTFKGRYRTLYDIGFTKSIRGLIGSAIHADEFAYGKKGTKDRLSDVNIDNLKMALREMQVLISLMATAALLKAAFEDLDDDDFLKGAGYVAINQLYRVEQDIYFYLSPNTFEEILRNPISVMQVYSDFGRAMTSSANYIMDSDFEGSRVAKDWGRALPLANQIIKTDYLSKNLH